MNGLKSYCKELNTYIKIADLNSTVKLSKLQTRNILFYTIDINARLLASQTTIRIRKLLVRQYNSRHKKQNSYKKV